MFENWVWVRVLFYMFMSSLSSYLTDQNTKLFFFFFFFFLFRYLLFSPPFCSGLPIHLRRWAGDVTYEPDITQKTSRNDGGRINLNNEYVWHRTSVAVICRRQTLNHLR